MVRTQKGFTLIELVMVIVILGILAAVAIPKYLDLSTQATANAVLAGKGAVRSAFTIAFANHRLQNELVSGAGVGTTQWVADCTTAAAYLSPPNWQTAPNFPQCAGSTITWQDSSTSLITAESLTTPATIP